MARDKLCLAVDATTLRLIVHLLKMDKEQKTPDYAKFAKAVSRRCRSSREMLTGDCG
jgi:hypothetical protein